MRCRGALASWLFCLALVCLCLEPVGASRTLLQRQKRLLRVAVGMKASAVRRWMGERPEVRLPWTVLQARGKHAAASLPSRGEGRLRAKEIQAMRRQRGRLAGEAYRWAYGARFLGAFARVGLVFFSKDHHVIAVEVPPFPSLLRPKARQLPTQVSASAPLGCRISLVGPSTRWQQQKLRVTLFNRGKQDFLFRHNHTAISFELVVEVYDARKRLMWKFDNMSLYSPFGQDRSKWPVLRIPAGGTRSTTAFVWNTSRSFGLPPFGRYFVRVAFPFHHSDFTPSNLLPIEVRAPQPPSTR